jgi:hypothetical protein
VNTVENSHKFLQNPDEKFDWKDVNDIKAKDKKVVGLFRDGQVIVWDLISGVIVYQFDSEIRRLYLHTSGFIYSFNPSLDEIIILDQQFHTFEPENELSVWRRSSQPERFRDIWIKSPDLEYVGSENNLAIVFGQFVRPDVNKEDSNRRILKVRSVDDPHLEEKSRALLGETWYPTFFSPTLIILEENNKNVHPNETKVLDFLNLKQFLVGQT